MPLDINAFRAYSGGDPEAIRESQRRRYASVELVDEIIAKDDRWRFLTGSIDNMKKKRNAIQKDVATKKKANEACDELVAQIKSCGDEIITAEQEQEELRMVIASMIGKVGNLVDDSVPVSKDEDADNAVVRKWGVPRDPAGLLNHHDLLWRIGGYEPERGAAVAGHRGYFLRDVGVMLNQAFINYGIAFLRARNYCVLQPPYFMKKDVMAGVAQLEQFDEELYKVGGDGDDKYLIATSEQPICGYHMGEWMEEKNLPLRYAGISTCFRKEAGSHGRDTWGIFRVHQFEKVEQFVIVEGDLEKSKLMQDEMIRTAEEFYQSLGFPYHVINIVSGALNNAAIKKLDLECWFPGYNAYRELVSCSNCTDYQSRSMEIRCGLKKMGDREKKYVHMLNATLCATGRAICCLLETYQESDGVRVPEVLVPFMGGLTFLPFVRDSKAPTPGGAVSSAAAAKPAKAAVPVVPRPSAATADATPPAAPFAAVDTASVPAAEPRAAIPVVPAAVDPNDPIAVKGEEIRLLKAAKAEKAEIMVLVEQLKLLKADFLAKTGREYDTGIAPAPKEAKAKPDKKAADKKVVKAPAFVEGPIVIKPFPAYTSPAPAVSGSAATVRPGAAIAEIFATHNDTAVTLRKLDDLLKKFSYVAGFRPSAQDTRTLALVKSFEAPDQLVAFPNIARWVRNITSFSAEDCATWTD